MTDEIIRTLEEAERQPFTLPALGDWVEFAALIDGYTIANELGFDLLDWANKRIDNYRETGYWHANIMELRLLLFFFFRADHFAGGSSWAEANSLLIELSRQTGQPLPTAPRAKHESNGPVESSGPAKRSGGQMSLSGLGDEPTVGISSTSPEPPEKAHKKRTKKNNSISRGISLIGD